MMKQYHLKLRYKIDRYFTDVLTQNAGKVTQNEFWNNDFNAKELADEMIECVIATTP